MVNINKSDIKISWLEKGLVNFALPSDFLYHTIKSKIRKDLYSNQTSIERWKAIYNGKINKYLKLLIIKKERSEIPEKIKNICKDSLCGKMRLALTYFR